MTHPIADLEAQLASLRKNLADLEPLKYKGDFFGGGYKRTEDEIARVEVVLAAQKKRVGDALK